VRIRAAIESGAAEVHRYEVAATVRGPGGRMLAQTASGSKVLGPGAHEAVELVTRPIADSPVWSIAAPQLATPAVELRADGPVIRRVEAPFGIRRFRFDPEKGFSFNGAPLKLRGAVYYRLGAAPKPDRRSLWDYEIGLLKGMGLNFVRVESGIDASILDEFDRAGMLATIDVHADAEGEALRANLARDVESKYNHPSVIAWHYNGEGKDARAARRYTEAARELRSLDPGRAAFCVELGWRSPGTVGLVDADVAGQGNYTGWYEGTLEHIGPYLDDYRELLRERYGRYL